MSNNHYILNNNIITIIFQYLQYKYIRQQNSKLLNKNLLYNFLTSKTDQTFFKPVLEIDIDDDFLCVLDGNDILTKEYIISAKRKLRLNFPKSTIRNAFYLGNFKIAISFPRNLNIYSYNKDTLKLKLIYKDASFLSNCQLHILKNNNLLLINYEEPGELEVLCGKTYFTISSHILNDRIYNFAEVHSNRFITLNANLKIRLWDSNGRTLFIRVVENFVENFTKVTRMLGLRNGNVCIGLEDVLAWTISYGIWDVNDKGQYRELLREMGKLYRYDLCETDKCLILAKNDFSCSTNMIEVLIYSPISYELIRLAKIEAFDKILTIGEKHLLTLNPCSIQLYEVETIKLVDQVENVEKFVLRLNEKILVVRTTDKNIILRLNK
jgi:hypothetical protein